MMGQGSIVYALIELIGIEFQAFQAVLLYKR
jgi:hypothetical protein